MQGKSKHTEVLNVLVGEVADNVGRLSTGLLTSAPCLVNHDTVCEGSGEEGGAVAELGHATIIVHAQPREGVAGDADKKGGMSVMINISSAYVRSNQDMSWRENRLFRHSAPVRYRLAAWATREGSGTARQSRIMTYPANQATRRRRQLAICAHDVSSNR